MEKGRGGDEKKGGPKKRQGKKRVDEKEIKAIDQIPTSLH